MIAKAGEIEININKIATNNLNIGVSVYAFKYDGIGPQYAFFLACHAYIKLQDKLHLFIYNVINVRQIIITCLACHKMTRAIIHIILMSDPVKGKINSVRITIIFYMSIDIKFTRYGESA